MIRRKHYSSHRAKGRLLDDEHRATTSNEIDRSDDNSMWYLHSSSSV